MHPCNLIILHCILWIAYESRFIQVDSVKTDQTADAHAALSLYWAHMSECMLCRIAAYTTMLIKSLMFMYHCYLIPARGFGSFQNLRYKNLSMWAVQLPTTWFRGAIRKILTCNPYDFIPDWFGTEDTTMIKLSWVTFSGLKLLAGTKKLMGKVFALKKVLKIQT